MKIIIAGDYAPIGRIHDFYIHDRVGEVIPQDIAKVIDSADFSLVNFECPIIASSSLVHIAKSGPALNTSPIGLEGILKAKFKGVTLANNHFRDYGEEGVRTTLQACRAHGLKIVGGGDNKEEASQTLYVNNAGQCTAFINACEHEFSIANDQHGGSNPLNPISQYQAIIKAKQEADHVIVIIHGGIEHYSLPTPRMQQVYRFFIEAGADAVVNHHQHCFSGYEVWQGKPIFYGLGNFLFDNFQKRKNGHSPWNEGYMVELSFREGNVPDFQLIPYKQCIEQPCISLMTEKEKERFMEEIRRLNTIIANPKLLKEYHQRYMQTTEKNYRVLFSPYKSRIGRALFVRGWLPSVFGQRQLLSLLNIVQCESHQERLIEMLTRQIQ